MSKNIKDIAKQYEATGFKELPCGLRCTERLTAEQKWRIVHSATSLNELDYGDVIYGRAVLDMFFVQISTDIEGLDFTLAQHETCKRIIDEMGEYYNKDHPNKCIYRDYLEVVEAYEKQFDIIENYGNSAINGAREIINYLTEIIATLTENTKIKTENEVEATKEMLNNLNEDGVKNLAIVQDMYDKLK